MTRFSRTLDEVLQNLPLPPPLPGKTQKKPITKATRKFSNLCQVCLTRSHLFTLTHLSPAFLRSGVYRRKLQSGTFTQVRDGVGHGLHDPILSAIFWAREPVAIVRANPVEHRVWWSDARAFAKVLEVDEKSAGRR